MSWKLDKNKPICPQICEQMCVKIANGEFSPDQKLLSVREVAVVAGVNPNTVQKAFEQLEGMDMIYSVRGSGWYVKDNIERVKEVVNKLIEDKTRSYLEDMAMLGCNQDDVINFIKGCSK